MTRANLNMVGMSIPINRLGLGDNANLLKLSLGQISGDYTASDITGTGVFRVLNEGVQEYPWVTDEITEGESSVMAAAATEGTARVRDEDRGDLCRGRLKKRFQALWNETFQYREHQHEVDLEQLLGVIYAMWSAR